MYIRNLLDYIHLKFNEDDIRTMLPHNKFDYFIYARLQLKEQPVRSSTSTI